MRDKIVLNGEIIESDEVALGVRSEGFSFGFGLFETIKFQDLKPCFFKEHLDRLKRSSDAISMKLPFSGAEILRQTKTLFEVNGVRNGIFKIVLTRTDQQDSCVLYLRDSTDPSSQGAIRLRLSSVIKSSQAFTTNNKTLNYLENLIEKRRAEEHGFDECLFINEAGYVTECATANIFVVKDGLLKTPSDECGLLSGVIRGQVLRIAREQGLRVEEGNILPGECVQADEAFVTSSGRGLVSVSEIQADYSKTFATIGSKLVVSLAEKLRLAELASLNVFEK